jgi:hypothetical protein
MYGRLSVALDTDTHTLSRTHTHTHNVVVVCREEREGKQDRLHALTQQ